MRKPSVIPTGEERTFGLDEIIVSKTDQRGVLTYVNDVFMRVSAFTEEELIGKPHNVIRHPDMPRCVFSLLWDTIKQGRELFAYIVNLAGDGKHYWVLAHVTPSFNSAGQIVGYHSNRRVPERIAVNESTRLYAELCAVEARYDHPVESIQAGVTRLNQFLADRRQTYDEFVWDLTTSSMAGR